MSNPLLPRTFAYIRVSTWLQNAMKDKAQIEEYVVGQRLPTPVIWYEDHESGKTTWRDRKIFQIFEEAKKGDYVIITEMSRVARDITGALDCLKSFLDKGIFIHSIKERVVCDGSLSSNITTKIFLMMADIEKAIMAARMDDAKATKARRKEEAGFIKGVGKSKIDIHKENVVESLVKGVAKTEIAKMCSSSVNNLNTWLNKRGLDKKTDQLIIDKVLDREKIIAFCFPEKK